MNENVTLTKTEAPSWSEATSAYEVHLNGEVIGVVYKYRHSTPLYANGHNYTYGSSVRTAWTWKGPGFSASGRINKYRLNTNTRTKAVAKLIEEATR